MTHLVRERDVVGLKVGNAVGLGVREDCAQEKKRRKWQRKAEMDRLRHVRVLAEDEGTY